MRESIAVKAYYIWEREGRPFGRADAHWFLALREVETGGAVAGEAEDDPGEPPPPSDQLPGWSPAETWQPEGIGAPGLWCLLRTVLLVGGAAQMGTSVS